MVGAKLLIGAQVLESFLLLVLGHIVEVGAQVLSDFDDFDFNVSEPFLDFLGKGVVVGAQVLEVFDDVDILDDFFILDSFDFLVMVGAKLPVGVQVLEDFLDFLGQAVEVGAHVLEDFDFDSFVFFNDFGIFDTLELGSRLPVGTIVLEDFWDFFVCLE